MANSIVNNLATALKGFLMGAANVVPGVSGGTVALITGIYHDLIEAINSVMEKDTWTSLFHGEWRRFWKQIHGTFLFFLAIGVVASVVLLAEFMSMAIKEFPIQTWSFFFGLIVASAVIMVRDIKNWKIRDIIFIVIGIALGVAVCTLSPTQTPDDLWFIFITGAVAVCTMILPGVSGSFILLIFGKYEYIMDAIAEMNILVLAVFALGCVVGILAFSKLLHILLKHFEKQTMLLLLGFVLGSLVKVWPWANPDAILLSQGMPENMDPMYGAAAIWCVLGIIVVAVMDILGNKIGAKQKN